MLTETDRWLLSAVSGPPEEKAWKIYPNPFQKEAREALLARFWAEYDPRPS